MNLLIKNGHIINPDSGIDKVLDILIVDGRVDKIDVNLDESMADKVIDAGNMIVAPGFVDIHAHLREPGNERAETMESGCKAAMNGGFTTVTAMPNTNPCMDNAAIVSLVREKAHRAGYAKVCPVGAVSKGREGRELAAIGEMVHEGIVAVSDDGSPVATAELMKKALEYCQLFGIPVMEHAEEVTLTRGAVMNEGFMSTKLGLKGMPTVAEDIVVARDIILNRYVRGWLHVSHLSSAYSLDMIRRAKERGDRVTTEVTPHHLFFNDSRLEQFDTNFVMKPPVRVEADRLSMIEGIKDGTIDCIATDHAPHPHEYKNCEIDICAFGIIGFETAISAVLDVLYHRYDVPLKRIVECMSTNPAKIIGMKDDRLRVGAKADITVFSTGSEVVIRPERFKSRSRNTPFKGMKLKGCPVYAISGTRVVRCDVGEVQ
ncbi:MAG: dihydroorotase [Acidobacteria bacterium]|nr:dihydroorotase [Acidobacteriota bacterium]